MSNDLPPIFFDHRLVTRVPEAYHAAVQRAAAAHGAPVADYVRYALNQALAAEPTAGIDGNFALVTTLTESAKRHGGAR